MLQLIIACKSKYIILKNKKAEITDVENDEIVLSILKKTYGGDWGKLTIKTEKDLQ